ncbi:MAG TPA: ISL3 family transposase [Candidatus Binatia bacterium]|nr:ISL3 family transposase [Candidatus Binatia bacterium]
MIPEKAFERLLGLDECWEVTAAEYESEPVERFVLIIGETEKLWPKLVCPDPKCTCTKVVCHDHAPVREWRHLDAFGKRTVLLCEPPRARCTACEKVWRVPVPWEGEGKHFTRDFEAFALTLMREMPMTKAGDILGETDTRLWRLLFAHVDKAYAALDLSELVHLGVDEMSSRKGHHYLTVFADLVKKRVVFATEGKDHTTFQRFAEEILTHNGHPKAITAVAMDMSSAYQKGAREELGNARIVFDPFHVSALVSQAVDEVRRREAAGGQAALAKTIYLFRKNPENLSEQEQERLDELDLKHLATGQAYLIRLELRDIYQHTIKPERARDRLERWVKWVRRKCERFGAALAPLAKVANTVEQHLEGILAHWSGWLSTAFLEGLNSVFSAVKRKARGYRSSEYMIAILYFVAGKLAIPSFPSHSK